MDLSAFMNLVTVANVKGIILTFTPIWVFSANDMIFFSYFSQKIEESIWMKCDSLFSGEIIWKCCLLLFLYAYINNNYKLFLREIFK